MPSLTIFSILVLASSGSFLVRFQNQDECNFMSLSSFSVKQDLHVNLLLFAYVRRPADESDRWTRSIGLRSSVFTSVSQSSNIKVDTFRHRTDFAIFVTATTTACRFTNAGLSMRIGRNFALSARLVARKPFWLFCITLKRCTTSMANVWIDLFVTLEPFYLFKQYLYASY